MALSALLKIENLIKMLIQILEMVFLSLLGKCSATNPGGGRTGESGTQTQTQSSTAKNPEEYLTAIGYPGYGEKSTYTNEELSQHDPMDYSDDLTEIYEGIIGDMKLKGQDELIEKVYDANFTMIGYRREKI